MWEVQHLVDAAVPATIGIAAAGAVYFFTERVRRRREALERVKLAEAQIEIASPASIARAAEAIEFLSSIYPASAQRSAEFHPETIAHKLRSYRDRDPGYKKAIARVVDAEASLADPVEGTPVEEKRGPAQRRISEILGA